MLTKETLYSMLIYAVTFFLSVVCVYKAERKKNFRPIWQLLAIIIPSITAAWRQCGVDYQAYEGIYNHIHQGNEYPIEKFWILLNRIAPTYQWLLFLSAFLFLWAIYFAICKLVKNDQWLSWFIILVVCYPAFYNVMRQMIAVAFAFLAFAFLCEKKNLFFVLNILIATLFHKSAILMLVAFPVYFWVIKRFKDIEILILGICLLCPLAIKLLPIVLGYFGIYGSYFNKEINGFSFGFLLYSLPPLYFYYVKRKSIQRTPILKYSLAMYLLVIPFQVLGMSIAYADRIMLYFQIMIAVFVPHTIRQYDILGKKHSLRTLYVIWFIIHYLVLVVLLNGNATYPYTIF